METRKKIYIGLGVFLLIFVIFGIFDSFKNHEIKIDNNNNIDYNNLTLEQKVESSTSVELYHYCEKTIKEQLKNPKESNFSEKNIQVTHQKGKEVLVTGVVEAPNSFNVKVKNSYACYFSYEKGAKPEFNLVEAKLL